ncbi:Carboxylesterase, partial [Thamnocephalis sphaerospora]
IPYAAPPVGEKRFRPPQPLESAWGGTLSNGTVHGRILDARTPPADCLQYFPSYPQSENCLYLNVYTPSVRRIAELGGRVPVMLWIFPGAFFFGSSYHFGVYDGSHLASANDAVVVTFNYRLGPLGFFAGNDDQGNAAILDQVAAMQWVKRNIANFGGDPDNITMWGVSAGAYSALIHLTSPTTPPGLFHRAIIQS